ncbi:uncharacterized protein [Clytia hemisphaerica]|uniref:uncharacterized protein n=1 Tax=Clytia hemisphaerica TaxID=252671 RepID=UPI0034D771C6
MTIRYVEVRSDHWSDAPSAIIDKLKNLGVKKGQIVWIDAHCAHIHDQAIISAYWDDHIASEDPLDIRFYLQNYDESWASEYENAVDFASKIQPQNLISITGSGNIKNKSVCIVFYYDGPEANPRQNIRWKESRSSNWSSVANDIIKELKNAGAKQGQIIGIDAHANTDKANPTIQVGFWNASLPGNGDLNIEYKMRNDKDSYDTHYKWACNLIDSQNGNPNIYSVTTSQNDHNSAATFVYGEPDEILSIDYDLDNGKITDSKPEVLETIDNNNDSPADQILTFTYKETTGTSTENTSSFSNEVGASFKVGTKFSTGIPFIAEGQISMELTALYNHTWGKTKSISNDFSTSSAATASVKANPYTKITCAFSVQKSDMDVPYTMTMKSGKKSSGTWKGVNCWDFKATFKEEPLEETS